MGSASSDRGSCARRPLQGSGDNARRRCRFADPRGRYSGPCFDYRLAIEAVGSNDEIVKVSLRWRRRSTSSSVGLTSCRTAVEASILSVEQAQLANGNSIG